MAMDTNEAELEKSLKEEMERYDEDGYFKRLGKMFAGFSKPRDSREYKLAVIELQRQSAPLSAILIPVIAIAVLVVVSAVGGRKPVEIKVEIAQAEKEVEKLEEIEPPKEIEPPPESEIDPNVVVDSPNVGNPNEIASSAVASNEPVSPKVNNVDTMMNISSPVTMRSVLGGERTGARGRFTRGGAAYGDGVTEAAVLKALRWLKHTQNSDGSWSGSSPTAMTGFAVLTYLAHGETPASKEFGETVQKALDYLIYSNSGDGAQNKFAHSDGHEYAYPIATYALSEAYGMTHNPNCKDTAEKGIRRIIDGQTATGGWNYNLAKVTSETPDDISYGGWCMQALKAAKMAGIHLDGQDDCIKRAINCLKTRNYDEQLGFLYRPGNKGTSKGLGGVGCLAMQLLGYGREPEVRNALSVMREWLPAFDPAAEGVTTPSGSPQYYCYYASQCKYQAGMSKTAAKSDTETWKKWNVQMKKLYPSTIVTLPEKIMGPDGKEHEMGYWTNRDNNTSHSVMDTCLCALQLMVYYRYLPTTSLKASEVEADVDAASKSTDDVKVDAGNI